MSEVVPLRSALPEHAAAAANRWLPPELVRELPPSVILSMRFKAFVPEFTTGAALPPMMSISLASAPSEADASLSLAAVERSMAGCFEDEAIGATARMRVATKQRPMDKGDELLMLTVYGEKLAQYPADAIAIACEKWLETSPWWPAIAEILPYCESAMQPRRSLRLELVRALAQMGRGR
jgi:hypothetical protein